MSRKGKRLGVAYTSTPRGEGGAGSLAERLTSARRARDELATPIKKTRSHGTIAKRVGLAKRPRSAKGLPISSSRVGRQSPVRNSLDHLVGAEQGWSRQFDSHRFGGLKIDCEFRVHGFHLPVSEAWRFSNIHS